MRCFSVSIKSRKLSASPVHAKCIMQSGREMIINYQNEQHGKRERERYATLCIRSSSHAHAAAHMPGCRFRKCLCQCVKSNMYRKHSKKKNCNDDRSRRHRVLGLFLFRHETARSPGASSDGLCL